MNNPDKNENLDKIQMIDLWNHLNNYGNNTLNDYTTIERVHNRNVIVIDPKILDHTVYVSNVKVVNEPDLYVLKVLHTKIFIFFLIYNFDVLNDLHFYFYKINLYKMVYTNENTIIDVKVYILVITNFKDGIVKIRNLELEDKVLPLVTIYFLLV